MKGIFRLPMQRMNTTLTRPCLISMQYCQQRHFSNYLYSEDHEWIQECEGGNYTVGITEYAQDSLGEIVFVELPDIGDEFNQGEVFGQIESVKAASELYMPVSGKVVEVWYHLSTVYI